MIHIVIKTHRSIPLTPSAALTPPPPPPPPDLPEPLSGSLDSVSSHIKQGSRSPRREDPGTTTSAHGGICGEDTLASEAGGRERTRCAMSRCHWDLSSRLGGCHGGEDRRSEGPTPAGQPAKGGERRRTGASPSTPPLLRSALLTLQLRSPLLLPLLTEQLDN